MGFFGSLATCCTGARTLLQFVKQETTQGAAERWKLQLRKLWLDDRCEEETQNNTWAQLLVMGPDTGHEQVDEHVTEKLRHCGLDARRERDWRLSSSIEDLGADSPET